MDALKEKIKEIISIHASREGSDVRCYAYMFNVRPYFNPRFPRGKRLLYHRPRGRVHQFQSTLPAREATSERPWHPGPRPISIHASREGSDSVFHGQCGIQVTFQSTLPAREATRMASFCFSSLSHFNPRFPRGKRHFTLQDPESIVLFQSTLPAREATLIPTQRRRMRRFQSTLPAREATALFRSDGP